MSDDRPATVYNQLSDTLKCVECGLDHRGMRHGLWLEWERAHPSNHPAMPIAAEEHLYRLQGEIWKRVGAKYRAGQAEHGGVLPQAGIKVLLDSAIDEAVDQIVYLLTLKELLDGITQDRK